MSKIVISGSIKLFDKIEYWVNYFQNNNYEVLDYPKEIDANNFIEVYPKIHKEFYENIKKTDILFIMNEDKNNIKGYIGSAMFAEIAFGLAENLVNDQKIELVLLQMPSEQVYCYDEIMLWLKLGWVKIWNQK